MAEALEAKSDTVASDGLWPSVPLATAIVLYGLVTAAQSTTLSLFLADAVHVVPFLIGLFFSAQAAWGIGTALVTGWVSDRMPDRRVMIGLTGLCGAIGGLCLALLRDYGLVLVTFIVFGSLGQGAFGQLFGYSHEFADARGRDVTAFTSGMRSVFSAAYVIGPPLGLSVMARYGFRPLYLGVAVASLAYGCIGRWGIRKVPPRVSAEAPGRRRGGGSWRMLRNNSSLSTRTWLLLAVILVLGIVNQMYVIDISLYVTTDLRHGPELVGWMLGLTAGLEIPVMIGVGRIARRVGRERLVSLSAVLATVTFCVLPLSTTAGALLGVAALQGIWQGIALSLPMVMIQDEAAGGVGAASSLYGAAFATAGLVGGAVTGVAASEVGYGNVLWICAALSAVAALLMLIRLHGFRSAANAS